MGVKINTGSVVTNTETTIVDNKGNELDIIEQVVAQEEGRLPNDMLEVPNSTDELAGLTAEEIHQKIDEDKAFFPLIREFNMPKKAVFPKKCMKNPRSISCLFGLKKEM